MAKNYAALARSVIAALGGVDNISAVTHCMTRLRFVIKDDALIDSPTLKTIPGVLGVVRSDNQCQVIIGNTVSQAFQEVVSLLPGDMQPAQPVGKPKLTLRRIGAGILDALIGMLTKGSPTLTILNVIGDGAFFFLPLMVAASAAIKFKTNMSLAIAIAGVLVHPSFIELMAKAAQGEHVEFALIPVTAVKYTYTVIPALVMTWCLSYIERWVDRITPAVTKNFLKPMLIVLIAAPLAILLIGPIGIWIGSAISALVYTIHGYLGWLSVAIMGALWPLLVMTGMHRVFTPTIIQTIAETGKEGMVMPSEIGANLSLGGSSLAVAWKTKNPELRQTALAAAASAIMAGISEPALYGVAIRLKRPLIASLISGFICGAVAGMAGLASHSMAAPGLFTSVQFFDPANPMSIVWVFAVMALAVVLSFILTLLLGFEDIPVEEAAAQARKYQSVQPTVAKEVSLN
ncbi:PTS cellobiose/arbutin/salicin transporter subunit IIBC [Escherichia coli]|nr:PTS cellobiose/arbutin/salicin transporter subunit IIBC [Escherichia coli]EJK7550458.1 PTS cellobiose/arbutin/salicin transporter subunit IIBC [Escherichia coli]EJK7971519.1 PTS cellobiose/arbutin/salicin transporter subunit IIBC [Escherichia coli]EJK8731633.1 PTS cellobiose/arbutin/salicin transporter subunit IIBC [Escherichia coli]EJT1278437.1 PTS cellobiose/arbutin/salicin transporter subunit IIBC [Escherichia coli]